MKTKQNIYIVVMTFTAMFFLAIADGARGIFIPTFKQVFNVEDSAIGMLFTMSSFAYFIGSYIGSALCPKFGQKNIILFGIILASGAFFSASFAFSFTYLVICYVMANLGFSIMAIGMNTLIPMMPFLYLGVLMNLLHFFYGLGSTISQRITGLMLSVGISWQNIFQYFSFGFILLFILYLFVTMPIAKVTEEKHDRRIKNKKLLAISCICLAMYVAAEIQTANWLFNYYQYGLHINTNKGSLYVSLFFAFFSFGRLFGGFVAEKIGYLRSITFSLVISTILYTIGIILEHSGVFIIAISGLFFSIVFPTLVLVIQQMFPNNESKATGIATMSAAVMSTASGVTIGIANDYLGVKLTMYIIPLALIAATISIVFINKYHSLHYKEEV